MPRSEICPSLARNRLKSCTRSVPLSARLRLLEVNRDALYETLKQFAPELVPASIGTAEYWRRTYGSKGSPLEPKRHLQGNQEQSKK